MSVFRQKINNSLETSGRRDQIFRWSVLVFVILIASAGLFYLAVNGLGTWAWSQCRKEIKAKGESLDLKDFIPSAVPDDKNLALIPVFRQLKWDDSDKLDSEEVKITPDTGMPFWEYLYREMEQRPLTRWPLRYDGESDIRGGRIPMVEVIAGFIRSSPMLAKAQIKAGHPENARRLLEIDWRLCKDLMQCSGFYGSGANSLFKTSLPIFQDGLAGQAWSVSDRA